MSLLKLIGPTCLLLTPACTSTDVGTSDQDVIICGENECGSGQTYEDYLNGLPDVALSNEARALAIVSVVYGISPLQILDAHFVPYDQALLLCPGGAACAGVEVDCSVWLWWPGTQYTSGAAVDGAAISDSDFPGQIGKCAERLRGTAQDVAAARAALRADGL